MTASVAPVRTLLAVCLVLVAGCKDKPTKKAPPPNVGSAGSGHPAPDLLLPHGDGTPPPKTKNPLTKADYERLAKMTFTGFEGSSRNLADNAFEIYQTTKDRPKLGAVITMQPCFQCVPMELDKWKARTEDLKVYLGPLKDQPGIDFEVGQTALNGQPIIYTYQVGVAQAPGGKGGPSTSYTNSFIAYYNDGVNQIRVLATYKDDPLSKDQLIQAAPKADLELLALAFLDVYTHGWK